MCVSWYGVHRTCSTCIELLDYNCLYFTGLPHAGESEVWETETRSDLAEDIGEIADVECTMDEIEGMFPQTQKNSKAMSIVWLISHFLLELQRKHFLPDSVLSLLLSFFSITFHIIGISSTFVKEIALLFPPSLHCLHKLLGYQKDEFMKYVVCANPKCSAVYKYDDCVEIAGRHWSSKLCSNLTPTGTILVMTC